ncbi:MULTISPECIES: hypothetical protein [Cupriavidus]|uniref:Type 1 fimbrial protein n=2 Tax=Cupriavidus TaxID=106589 RepID=A0A1U9UWW9_CUPNE|nr:MULTISPECIES: hypothetical protein [Cupriavidus]AQV97163.1 hypothetical protein BJN34_25215 [Cupriavidus necator]RDK04869.1 hypothetical protein DN412_40250 [Cupriavidus lacunae]
MSHERSRKAAGVAGRLVAASLLAAAGVGTAAAQTGTITFLGAISYPSCGFSPSAGLVQASCQQPSGQIVSAPFAVPPARLLGQTRIGAARLEVEPARAPDAYLVVVTYQ